MLVSGVALQQAAANADEIALDTLQRGSVRVLLFNGPLTAAADEDGARTEQRYVRY